MRYLFYTGDFKTKVDRSTNWNTDQEVKDRRDVAEFIRYYRSNGERWRVLRPGVHMVSDGRPKRTNTWFFRIEEDQ